MNEWMDEWMDEWMNETFNGMVVEHTQTHSLIYLQRYGFIDLWYRIFFLIRW
jgi:hypothetical protein